MRRRWPALVLASLLVLAVGILAGRRTTEQASPKAQQIVTVTVPSAEPDRRERMRASRPDANRRGSARTPAGAVATATAYIAELSGTTITDAAAIRRTLAKIASAKSREGLVRAYAAAADALQERLGNGTVVVRTTPVGYRVDAFRPRAATVSIWRVGIVGSGAAIEPQQSWRTETISLVWEGGTWKLDGVHSTPGPTPPLAGPPSTPAEVFGAVSDFTEVTCELR